jgi:hypothetical protein
MYPRGKNVHARRPRRGPSPNQTTVEGRIKPCKRGRTEQTVQTFPRRSNELNFGYHVNAWPPMYHKPIPAGNSFSAACTRASDFSRSHARIDITTILHDAPQLHYTRYILHTQYAPHLPEFFPVKQLLLICPSSGPCSKVPVSKGLLQIPSH